MRVGASTDDQLRYAFARASGLLLSDQAVDGVLRLLTATACRAIAAASGAGITTIGHDGEPLTTAGTGPDVEAADAVQYDVGEGPCLTAWRERRVVRVDDAAADGRWPRWAEAVAPLGVVATLSAALVAGDETVGAIKLYATKPGAFDAEDEATLGMFAAQAAVLVHEARAFERAGRLGNDVQAMLRRRDEVERATGFLMGRDHLDADAAFARLIEAAQHDGHSVHDVAVSLLANAGPRR
jgi:GAF domain-containing protein